MSEGKISVIIDIDLEDLIPDYLENRRKDIEQMQSALEVKDYEPIVMTAHSMKGSGGGYGFDRITEIGALIEQAGKDTNDAIILSGINELIGYLDNIEITYEE